MNISNFPRHWALTHLGPQLVIYVHGFGSSMHSSKARAFEDRLCAQGYSFLRLSFDAMQPEHFRHLRISDMVSELEQVVGELQPSFDGIHLIGSSMGATVATQLIRRRPEYHIRSFISLAGAFDISANRLAQLGEDGLQRWRERGYWPFFHHAANRELPLGTAFLDDLESLDPWGHIALPPSLFIHGQADQTVDWQQSERMHRQTDGSQLVLIADADHSLMDRIEQVLDASLRHLARWSAPNQEAVGDCVASPAVQQILREELS